jgi:hypothetical protein
MSKYYNVEAKFGTKWVLLEVLTRQTDALHYVREKVGERYKMRVVKVERTIVFEEK